LTAFSKRARWYVNVESCRIAATCCKASERLLQFILEYHPISVDLGTGTGRGNDVDTRAVLLMAGIHVEVEA